MFDTGTKILISSTGFTLTYTDYSSILLTEGNTEAVRFNSNNTMYIGYPRKFLQTTFVVSSDTPTTSGLTIQYWKGGLTPAWTSISAAGITNTTSGVSADSTFRQYGSIKLKETSPTWYANWIKTTVDVFAGLYWLKITVSGGVTYFKNVFNYLDDFENINLEDFPQASVIPMYYLTLRPNKPIRGS